MRSGLEALSQLLLGGWLGATWLFALVIAPTAFRVLPSVESAGQLVGPVLTTLNGYGMGAGISLGVIARVLERPALLQILPWVMALLCAISEFAVTAAIGDVLPHEFNATSDVADGQRFATLHQLSRAIFISVAIGTAVLIVLQSRASLDPKRGASPDLRHE